MAEVQEGFFAHLRQRRDQWQERERQARLLDTALGVHVIEAEAVCRRALQTEAKSYRHALFATTAHNGEAATWGPRLELISCPAPARPIATSAPAWCNIAHQVEPRESERGPQALEPEDAYMLLVDLRLSHDAAHKAWSTAHRAMSIVSEALLRIDAKDWWAKHSLVWINAVVVGEVDDRLLYLTTEYYSHIVSAKSRHDQGCSLPDACPCVWPRRRQRGRRGGRNIEPAS